MESKLPLSICFGYPLVASRSSKHLHYLLAHIRVLFPTTILRLLLDVVGHSYHHFLAWSQAAIHVGFTFRHTGTCSCFTRPCRLFCAVWKVQRAFVFPAKYQTALRKRYTQLDNLYHAINDLGVQLLTYNLKAGWLFYLLYLFHNTLY